MLPEKNLGLTDGRRTSWSHRGVSGLGAGGDDDDDATACQVVEKYEKLYGSDYYSRAI